MTELYGKNYSKYSYKENLVFSFTCIEYCFPKSEINILMSTENLLKNRRSGVSTVKMPEMEGIFIIPESKYKAVYNESNG